jgi:hypothetical protein
MANNKNISLTIDQIKVTIDINIPNKIGKPVELTRSMLHYQNDKEDTYYKLSNYPYFTTDVKYPTNYLNKLEYRRRVEFFFSNEKFKEILLEKSVYSENGVSDVENVATISNDDSRKIIKHNIETMIQVLLPTKFPIINNYVNSFDHYILNKPNFDFTFKDAIPTHLSGLAPHLPVKYSYIKIDDKIYTNSKVIWLNDIINHPVYRDLINSYIIFDKWRQNKRVFLKTEVENQKKKLKIALKKMDPADIKEYIADISGNKASTTARTGFNSGERTAYIDKLILQINKVYDDIENDNVYVNIENLREIFNITTYNIIIPKQFKTHLSKIFGISKQIEMITEISLKYFEEEMNIHFEDDNNEMKQYFQSNFKEYIDFIKKIEKYNKPVIESENKELQEIIYGYTQGFDNKFPLYLDYVKNKYINNQPKRILEDTLKKLQEATKGKSEDEIKKLLYIGVNITENITAENPRYSIYLQVDLIGGELNDSNKSKILCKYKGEHYGDQFMRYRRKNKGLNTYEVPKKRMYFDIDEIKIRGKKEQKNITKKKTVENKENKENKEKEKGLNGGTKRFYRYTRKSR